MSQSLLAAASELRLAAHAMREAATGLLAQDVGPAAFGASGPGRLGDLGHDLHRQWVECVQAREREARAHASRCEYAADALTRAAGRYADTDERARQGQEGT